MYVDLVHGKKNSDVATPGHACGMRRRGCSTLPGNRCCQVGSLALGKAMKTSGSLWLSLLLASYQVLKSSPQWPRKLGCVHMLELGSCSGEPCFGSRRPTNSVAWVRPGRTACCLEYPMHCSSRCTRKRCASGKSLPKVLKAPAQLMTKGARICGQGHGCKEAGNAVACEDRAGRTQLLL